MITSLFTYPTPRQDMAEVTLKLEELRHHVGEELGTTPWHEVTQKQVNEFADATLDYQWIHTDPERAAASPYGGTIAHGFLTLSLAAWALEQVLEVADATVTINYGLNKVRFPAPLRTGSSVRVHVTCEAAEDVTSGLQVTFGMTFERADGGKPACVAEVLIRYGA
jgi:acyl dehydratase